MITKSEMKRYHNIRKNVIFIITLFMAISIETSLRLVVIGGIVPLILPCILVYVAMSENLIIAGIYGIIGGLMYDIILNNPIGMSCIVFTVTCVVISLLTLHYVKSSMVCFILLVLLFTLFYQAVIFVNKYNSLGYSNLVSISLHNGLLSIIYTVLISPVIFYLYKVLNRYSY